MMILNFFYLVLAILGLGLLIFIHELGHYWAARLAGMKVEVFSIGFGPTIRQWEMHGVKWKLCMLPFGGYVRIAGMEKKDGLEPYQIAGGFYSKTPFQRIKVALAGPITNIIFAFFAFTLIWISGGQEKPFQQLTHIVGYVDSESSLKAEGVHPGDLLTCLNGKAFDGYGDLLMQIALASNHEARLQGKHIDNWTKEKTPFSFTLSLAENPSVRVGQLGILPAQYLIFEKYSSPAAPLKGTGIEKGDRIVWAEGSFLFSQKQLSSLLNDSTSLITVQRGEEVLLVKLPRLKITDLRLSQSFKDELDDWRVAAALKGRISDFYFIPYQINSSNVVEGPISFMSASAEEISPTTTSQELQPGDRIISVSGAEVQNSFDLFKNLQERRALIIVQKKPSTGWPTTPWQKGDLTFENGFDPHSLEELIQTIGHSSSASSSTPLPGSLHLLSPVRLKPLSELVLDAKTRAQIDIHYETQKKAIEKIEDVEERELQLSLLEQSQKRLMLGAVLIDRLVAYNPPPTTQFGAVFVQTWRTLTSLLTGSLTAKSLSGPVGIVQVLQESWSKGIKDSLFWLGFVSLNLAILNLLPIPVLDGGHILFSAIELVTKKPIRAKTMEKWILPFLILLGILFIYLTYQDIVRLFHRFFW